MRDSNHKSILTNRPVVTITSTVYDRRALDINSNIPLINSLNHLTYLTSNSGKVRETVAGDGALERLVSILHGCYTPLFDLLGLDLKHVSKHKRAQSIWKQKKQAMCAWKWTLAFQCLVLTGTRGTEQIRKKVVLSGVIPVLATVLDNYLIIHKNYDHIRGTAIEVSLSSLESEESYKLLRKDENETYEQYMAYITGEAPLTLSNDDNFVVEELLRPNVTLPSDFLEIWSTCATAVESKGNKKKANGGGTNDLSDFGCESEQVSEDGLQGKEHADDAFAARDDTVPSISIPRDFFLGKIVPKQDDVIWSLQLLAFISKYTYMKQQLQNVELVEPLSFRSILGRVRKRANPTREAQSEKLSDTSSPMSTADTTMEDAYTKEPTGESDAFLVELQSLVEHAKWLDQGSLANDDRAIQNPYRHFNFSISEEHKRSRIAQEKQLVEDFERNWDYNDLATDLDDETWSFLNSKDRVDLFPLVERCTVSHENPHDMVYWSSVIMRNSCRKNEVTGVRQCANFSCGKWEDYPRQFAKCRRCKRTKYCSRDCQLSAWTYHRYWCHEVGSSLNTTATTTGANTPNATFSSNSPAGHSHGTAVDFNTATNTNEDAHGTRIGLGVSLATTETGVAGLNVGATNTAPATASANNTDRLNIVEGANVIGRTQRISDEAMEQQDEMVLADETGTDSLA